MKKFTIIDCNNFWSPSGGGVRRYHQQKTNYFQNQSDVFYVHVQPWKCRETIVVNKSTVIERIPAFKIPGEWEYRYSIRSKHLKGIFTKYQPDVIEVGSPYFMPILVKKSIKNLPKRPLLIGFWHSDFPVTYVRRFFEKYGQATAKFMENLAWSFARRQFRVFDKVFVPSQLISNRLNHRGIAHTEFVPLGVNAQLFHPSKKDLSLVEKLKAGKPDRLTIFFPHRFCDEKGLKMTVDAYPILCELLGLEPALVFAGTGPDLPLVQEATSKYPHVRFLGFIENDDEMARWNASCEMGLALSGWETFGLSILEAMASGQMLIGANTGAALEHVSNSACGKCIAHTDPGSLVEGIFNLAQAKNKPELSKKARAYAENFTWDICFEKELALYKALQK